MPGAFGLSLECKSAVDIIRRIYNENYNTPQNFGSTMPIVVEFDSFINYSDLLSANASHWASLKRPNRSSEETFYNYRDRLHSYLKAVIDIMQRDGNI